MSLPSSQTPSRPPTPANENYSDTEQSRQPNTRNQAQQQQLPPEPTTEFQNFVISATGQSLPIYGAKLFNSVPSTFAPLDMTPVPADYVIGPNDELRIRVWGQVNFQANVRVDRSGDIFLPQIGPVHVAGIASSELEHHLHDAISRVYRNFNLTADVGQIRAIQVYLSGAARRPGVYTVSSLSTLVDTLFVSGGPSVQGSLRHIQVRRDGATVTDFDLYALLIHGDKTKDVKLQNGDVIFIPPVGAQAAVTGSVRNPAIYELLAGGSLGSLLADAGGTSTTASGSRISIERTADRSSRLAMEVADDSAGLTTAVTDGDMVRVYSIVPRYQKTVTLRGNTANPGRFSWHPGMHVSDLIPDKESLITRNYWWRRARLGLPAPEEVDLPKPTIEMFDRQQNPDLSIYQNQYGNLSQGQNQLRYQNPQQTPYQGLNPNGAQGPYQINQQPYQFTQAPYQSIDPSLLLLGQTQNQGPSQNQYQDQSQYPSQYPGQGAYPNSNQNQSQYPYQSSQQRANGGNGTSLGAAQNSVLSNRWHGSVQKTTVQQLAPAIDWDNAIIERLDPATLKSTIIPFDLGKLVMNHDASQDLELQAGDVISVFSEADVPLPVAHQTKYVTLGGEFAHAGVYTALEGETLRHLVQRAGGLTPDAYLYGSEFTRETTRAIQQARIDEYVQSLEVQIQRGSVAAAASGTGTALDLQSATQAQSTERDLLASLRQIRATGRIVLNFDPDKIDVNSIPDVALEDGDFFLIPSVPASVNVVGAVYDQNSFLYVKGARLSPFLQQAGGANRDADRKHEFVIRANGDVVSKQRNTELWSHSGKFDNLVLHPGDTIVVPEKVFKPSALRGFIDWSQIFSQLALGAAALSILK